MELIGKFIWFIVWYLWPALVAAFNGALLGYSPKVIIFWSFASIVGSYLIMMFKENKAPDGLFLFFFYSITIVGSVGALLAKLIDAGGVAITLLVLMNGALAGLTIPYLLPHRRHAVILAAILSGILVQQLRGPIPGVEAFVAAVVVGVIYRWLSSAGSQVTDAFDQLASFIVGG